MKKIKSKTEAGEQYAAAHEAHYRTKDLADALDRYRAVMAAHPEALEAGYSRSQIQNIVSDVVPQQELFDAQVELALAHVTQGNSPSIAPKADGPNVVDSTEEAT
jgi:hypothetical protein